MKFLSDREYNFLIKQLEYWEERAEKERDRADRAVDLITQIQGQLPISDIGLQEVKQRGEKVENILSSQRKDLSQIFAETMNEVEIEDYELTAEDAALEQVEG